MRWTWKVATCILLALSLVLSACGGAQTKPEPQASAQQAAAVQSADRSSGSTEKVTIRLATWAGVEEAK